MGPVHITVTLRTHQALHYSALRDKTMVLNKGM